MSRFDRGDRTLFDEAADAYDSARPGYPDALIQRLVEDSGLTARSRVLEIGCGTGQLTALLAGYGCQITAVELGPRLAERARLNLRACASVAVVTGDFETWQCSGPPFDLVVSAQAFHWIDPSIGYAKAHTLLKPTGTLALLWNLFPGGEDPLYAALENVYRAHAPMLCGKERESLAKRVERTTKEITSSESFSPPEIHRVPWTSAYTAEEYIDLLQTFSDHRALDSATRARLFLHIQETIERFGGRIERPWIATLFLSHPRENASAYAT